MDARLSVRAEAVRLPPATSTSPAPWTSLLSAEARCAAWRLVEASSRDGQPFDLELAWSAGDGSGARARVSVASASRVCVFARHLLVRGRAAGPGETRAAVHVADGFVPTHNVWAELLASGDAVAPPPFARAVRADLPDGGLLDQAWLVLEGPTGPHAEVPLDQQPSEGVWLAGTCAVRVRTATSATVRLTFALHL